MVSIIDKITILFAPVSTAIMLVFIYGLVARRKHIRRFETPIMGFLFGLAALASMHTPITLGDGVIIDLRNLFVAVAIALFGVVAGLISLAMAAYMRLSIGGAGAISGIVAIWISFAGALVWRHVLAPRIKSDLLSHALLGVMVWTHIVAGFMLAEPVRSAFFFKISPILLAMYTAGSVLLCTLVRREKALLNQVETFRQAAATDPLTGLLNRRSLEECVAALPQPSGRGLGRAVICFDIDCFKHINDTCGHSVGDAVLAEVTRRVQRCLRPMDIFGRLGGDEFVIVLPHVTAEAARRAAERCRTAIATAPITSGAAHEITAVPVTISVGASWSSGPLSYPCHLNAADEALYAAKRDGRNRVAFARVQPGEAGRSLAA